MKTIRLLYPDHVSGGLETYYFGANLFLHIIPENQNKPLVKVPIDKPNDTNYDVTDGIYARGTVLKGIENAQEILHKGNPDKIITIGGNCIVSGTPFDYLHGKYENVGIIWIDTHPDVSQPKDGYENAHAMVLAALLGKGDKELVASLKNEPFKASEVFYIGLQGLHEYQEDFLKEQGVDYQIQIGDFVSDDEIKSFISRFDHILLHLDIDVLDANLFHSTYFANKELVGDGSGSGKSTFIKKLARFIKRTYKSFYRDKRIKKEYDVISMVMQNVNYQIFIEYVLKKF